MQKGIFVSGIGTEVGKTVISAIITRALRADYWKPVQAGDLAWTDSMKVKAWTAGKAGIFHEEAFRLNTPASPHYAAAEDGIRIQLSDFKLPVTDNFLVVEGAGGLLVPLNSADTIADLIKQLDLAVVLVSRHYLGSINHTLLSIDYLQRRDIPIAGIVFNGAPTPSTSSIITEMSGEKVLFHLPEMEAVNPEQIAYWAAEVRPALEKTLRSKPGETSEVYFDRTEKTSEV